MEKSEIAELRAIPLENVLERFDAVRDPKDPKHNWKTSIGRLTVTGDKYYNHDAGAGGGGAIDLTMALGNFGFKEAVKWLGGEIGKDAAVMQYRREAEKHANRILDETPRPPVKLPEKDPSKWSRVRDYLVSTRAIPESIVAESAAKGRLWADRYGNAVFSLRNLEGEEVGVELRGTYEKPFHGVRGEKGLFVSGTKTGKTAAFVESAIEAMSYQALHPDRLAISTTGSSRDLLSVAAQTLSEKGFTLIDAFNRDAAGEKQGARLRGAVPAARVEVDRPNENDWNDALRARQSDRGHER